MVTTKPDTNDTRSLVSFCIIKENYKKQLNHFIKWEFVLRYLNGEKASFLGRELVERGLTNEKYPRDKIYLWVNVYNERGIQGLMNKCEGHGKHNGGRPKKDKPLPPTKERFKGWTQEEIFRYIEEIEKLKDVSSLKSWEKYVIVRDNCNFIAITKLCKVLGISTSSYHDWKSKGEKIGPKPDPKIKYYVWLIYFVKRFTYGHKRVAVEIERFFGVKVHYNTVRKYAKLMGLYSVIRQPSKLNKQPEAKEKVNTFDDLVLRDFKSNLPHQKLFTDVSYIWTENGWTYLSIVLDGFNNEIIGWSYSKHNDTQLVIESLEMAFNKIEDPTKTILHSDHGSIYFGTRVQEFKNKLGFTQSMGRKGKSLDNIPAEYFFSILKTEYIHDYCSNFEETFSKLNWAMYNYNTLRFQFCLEKMTPLEYAMSF